MSLANAEHPLDASSPVSDHPQTQTAASELSELALSILQPMGRGQHVSTLLKQSHPQDARFYPAREWMGVFHAFVLDAVQVPAFPGRPDRCQRCGTRGSGKTTRLLYLGSKAEHYQITVPEFAIWLVGYEYALRHVLRKQLPVPTQRRHRTASGALRYCHRPSGLMPRVDLRLAWRILHATTSLPYDEFLLKFERAIGDHRLLGVRVASSNPDFLCQILSRRFPLGGKPLRLLVAELRMFGVQSGGVSIVAKSGAACDAFHILASLSQRSFETFRAVAADPARRRSAMPPIVVIGSALAVHDPIAVATLSGRPVTLFPLPPLPLRDSEAYVMAGRDINHGSRTAVRRV